LAALMAGTLLPVVAARSFGMFQMGAEDGIVVLGSLICLARGVEGVDILVTLMFLDRFLAGQNRSFEANA